MEATSRTTNARMYVCVCAERAAEGAAGRRHPDLQHGDVIAAGDAEEHCGIWRSAGGRPNGRFHAGGGWATHTLKSDTHTQSHGVVILLLCVCVSVLGSDFQTYMESFFPYLVMALKNNAEYQVSLGTPPTSVCLFVCLSV